MIKGSKQFRFLSNAKAFQRKKQRAGYSTKLKSHLGIADPYRVVHYSKSNDHENIDPAKTA